MRYDAVSDCNRLTRWFKASKAEVVVNVGDIGELLLAPSFATGKSAEKAAANLLRSGRCPVFSVPGNHDLYWHAPLPPDEAMLKALAVWGKLGAVTLQTGWDRFQSMSEADTLFVGCMGFADFSHPSLPNPPYTRQQTVDHQYIDLSKGWQYWAKVMLDAFWAYLLNLPLGFKEVVVVSHYACLPEQTRFNPADEVSPFFFCHRLGLLLKMLAVGHPETNYYCVAGHSHEYNRGEWFRVSDNMFAYGFKAKYDQQDGVVVDLQPDADKLNANTVSK